MVDIKNLNRVKGILSAKQGAEIPKHLRGAKFAKYNGKQMIYSENGSSWFMDEDLTTPYTNSLSDFRQIGYNPQLPNISTKPSAILEIPGNLNMTPITAIESAAVYNNKVQEKTEEVKINTQVTPEVKLQQSSAGMSLQDPVKAQEEKKRLEDTFKQKELQEQKAVASAVTPALNTVSILGSGINAKQQANNSELTNTADSVWDATSTGLSNLGLAGQVASVGMEALKTIGNIGKELTGGTDQMTKTDKWMDSAWLSWNIGLINSAGGKTTQNFSADADVLASVGSSYGDAVSDINDAASKAGKKYGKFSEDERKAADKAINEARKTQAKMASISKSATDQRLAVQSMGEQAGLAYSMMTSGGYNQKYTYAAKHGGSLEWNPIIEVEWEPQIELNWELPTFKEGGNININEELEWIPEFKNGGKTEDSEVSEIEETTQKNVIPEGALHKNKHHMEHAEGLTKKGIPVIDDDREQQAEIEHSEIIFTLEVTKKLEEYYDIFYSDDSTNKEKEQAALDAGKLLVYQILENTEDRTGLIDSCKKGGTLTFKKSTDDLIEEALDWIPTIVVVEDKKPVEKSKMKEEKSDKELMKEAIKEALIELILK